MCVHTCVCAHRRLGAPDESYDGVLQSDVFRLGIGEHIDVGGAWSARQGQLERGRIEEEERGRMEEEERGEVGVEGEGGGGGGWEGGGGEGEWAWRGERECGGRGGKDGGWRAGVWFGGG